MAGSTDSLSGSTVSFLSIVSMLNRLVAPRRFCEEPVERARRTIVRSAMGFGSGAATGHKTGFRSDACRQYANELYALYYAKGTLNELPCDDAYEATLERQVVYGVYKPQNHFRFPKSEVKRHMREVIDKWLVHLDGLDVHHLAIEDIEIMDVDIMRSCGHCPKPHLSPDVAFAALMLLPPSLKLGNGKTQAKTAYLKWFDMDVLTTLLNRKGLFSLVAAEKRFKRQPTPENWRDFIAPKRAVTYAQRSH